MKKQTETIILKKNQSFSLQRERSGQKLKTIGDFHRFVDFNCGGDYNGLLGIILLFNIFNFCKNTQGIQKKVFFIYFILILFIAKKSIENPVEGSVFFKRYFNLLQQIKYQYEKAFAYDKRTWVSFARQVGETRDSLNKLNWGIGKELGALTGKFLNENNPGDKVVGKRGRNSIVNSPEMQECIEKFLYSDECSSIAANRICMKNNRPIRYFNSPKRTIFRKFIDKNNNIKISSTTFFTIIKKNFPEVILFIFILMNLDESFKKEN